MADNLCVHGASWEGGRGGLSVSSGVRDPRFSSRLPRSGLHLAFLGGFMLCDPRCYSSNNLLRPISHILLSKA